MPPGARFPLPEGFLPGIRALAKKHKVVLIFDEIITGFRWNPGGVQAMTGVIPDLTTLAKILTGGLPGGAVAGCEKSCAFSIPKSKSAASLQRFFIEGPSTATHLPPLPEWPSWTKFAPENPNAPPIPSLQS